MKLGSYEVNLEKKLKVTGWEVATISTLAILIALVLVSFIFLQAKVNPAHGYEFLLLQTVSASLTCCVHAHLSSYESWTLEH
jgi:uncharacterized sodium:solute symporter family permease YidK